MRRLLLFLLLTVVSAVYAGGYADDFKTAKYEHCSANSNIIILLDSSASISQADWAKMKTFILKLVASLTGDSSASGVFVGIAVYSTCAKEVRSCQPVNNVAEIRHTIYSMMHLCKLTNTRKGLCLAHKMILEVHDKYQDRDQTSNFVIVISDGESNRDFELTIPTADRLKEIPATIISVGVGEAVRPGTAGYNEMAAISSSGTVISVEDYSSLGDETIMMICKEFNITVGNPCPKGTPDVQFTCGVFKCQAERRGYYWRKYYSGCYYNQTCYSWGDEIHKPDDCNQYECARFKCTSSSDSCSAFIVKVVKVGCTYSGESECVMEGETRTDSSTCTTETCTRINGESGPFGKMQVTSKRCLRDGQCYNKGNTYTQDCDVYRCNGAGYYSPIKKACSYNGQCVGENQEVKCDCDIKKCVFNDKNELLQMVLVKRRCNDNGKCYDIGAKWRKDECKCIEYCCVEIGGEAVIRDEIVGCRKGDTSECTPVAGTVNKASQCIEYQCMANGNFRLVKAGCLDENGRCRGNGEKWRAKGACYINVCYVDTSNPSRVTTNIERIPDCVINGHCVLRGNTHQVGCNIFRCSAEGRIEIVSLACEYKGHCIPVDSKPFVDRPDCVLVSCVTQTGSRPGLMTTQYGCVEDGRCYDPDAVKTDRYTCKKKCNGEDHSFYPILCAVGHKKCIKPGEEYIDPHDCVSQICRMSSMPPGAELVHQWTGCFYDGKCYKVGETRGKCTIMKCTSNNIWVTVTAACELPDGTCNQIGDTWFDEEACQHYACKSQDGGRTAIIMSTSSGCQDNSNCVKHGEWIGDKCTKYQCKNGQIVQLQVACVLPDGSCLPVGKSKRDPVHCVEFVCKQVSGSPNRIDVRLTIVPGCRAEKCYFVGQTKNLQCKVLECKDGRRGLELLDITGCIDENGQCKRIGSTWENEANCVLRRCNRDGSITDTPLGCVDTYDNNRCVRFNRNMNTGGRKCQIHICKLIKRKPTRVVKYIGCERNCKCIGFGKSYVDYDSCKIFTCVKKEGRPAFTEAPYGCFSDIDEKCYKFGYVETEPDNNCIQYRCARGKNAFIVQKAECYYNGKCYRQGKMWYDDDTCVKYTCVRENLSSTYRVRTINKETEGCEDFSGSCINAGQKVSPGNCTQYVCDPDNGGLVLIKLQCQTDDGECKKIGESWTGNDNCAEYECVKVSETTVKIEVKEKGCKNDGRMQCYDDGQRVRKKCNIFECNGDTSSMEPVKMGCWYRGRCYDINESWKDSSCVTYTCVLVKKGNNFVITDIEKVQGCRHKGKCYSEGNTRREGCVVKECAGDGTWVMSVFKCKAEDGSCFGPGETYTSKDCTVYGCNADSLSVYPTEYACQINGKCVAVGTKWFNEKMCKYYKCVFNPATNEANPEVMQIGCKSNGQCMAQGAKKQGGCIEYKCVDGKLVIINVGCEYQGGCKAVGEQWMIGCVSHTCVIRSRDPYSVSTGIDVIHGCSDCYGKCHRPGSVITHGCVTQKCINGGKLITIDIKCLDKSSGNCVAIGSIIEVGGEKKECTVHGSFKIIEKPTHCTDSTGGKVAIDGEYKDTVTCRTMKCVLQGYSTTWVVVERGCSYEGKCFDIGYSWFDNSACKMYKCISSTTSGSSYPEIVYQNGCKSRKGLCYRIGQNWKDGCKEMECVKKGTSGSKVVVKSQGCESKTDHKCYKEGDQWTELIKGRCYLVVCKRIRTTYTTKVIRQVCRDSYGTCKMIGDSFYDCDVKGTKHYGCVCNGKKRKAYSTYEKNYKRPSDYEMYGGGYGPDQSYTTGSYSAGGKVYKGGYSNAGYRVGGGGYDKGPGKTYGKSDGYVKGKRGIVSSGTYASKGYGKGSGSSAGYVSRSSYGYKGKKGGRPRKYKKHRQYKKSHY